MNGLRRCAYWSSSNAATIIAPKAALRRGLIRTEGGVGTAPFVLAMGWARMEVGSTKCEVRRKRERQKTNSAAPERVLDVKFLGFIRALHDEPEPRRRVLAH